jgi:hypothetical protein
MAYPDHQLKAPPAAESDPESFEMARVWAAGGQQHVALKINGELDPAGWGLMLADLGRHVAAAYEQLGVCTAEAAFERILQGLASEVGGGPTLDDG